MEGRFGWVMAAWDGVTNDRMRDDWIGRLMVSTGYCMVGHRFGGRQVFVWPFGRSISIPVSITCI
jgi:hypothetical protein